MTSAGRVADTSGRAQSRPRLARRSARLRADLPFVIFDAALVASVYLGLVMLRFDGSVPGHWWARFETFLPIALAVHLAIYSRLGLYGSFWRYAGVREAQRLLLCGLAATAAVLVLTLWPPARLPLSVIVVGPLIATGLVGLSRFQARLFALRRRRPGEGPATGGLRIVILGAGRTGSLLAREMLSSPRSGLVPVAFLDDDPRIRGRVLNGIRVLGTIDELPSVAPALRLHQALLTVREAPPGLLERALVASEAGGIPLRIVPSVDELVSGQIGLCHVRDLRIDDLLGRHEVVTDTAAIHGLLAGRRVLITGGGGSIGSEIARQAHGCHPALLVLVDHDETHLHDAGLDLPGAHQVLADVRDGGQMDRIFATYRPEVVFHAAAHKHVPILEAFPEEALRTNVLGTANVLESAKNCGTERLILISSDKAVRAAGAMGASSRLAERLLVAHRPNQRWCAVRFGNVMATRGSVVPTFARQIEQGHPVTVTDPRMSRYFMSLPQAVALVLQAAVVVEGGEVFTLDMGDPVPIIDLARRMIRLSGRDDGRHVELRVVGRRPGEKLVEEFRGPDEEVTPTAHPAIYRISARAEDPDRLATALLELQDLARQREPARLTAALIRLARPGPPAPIEEPRDSSESVSGSRA